MTIHMLHCFDEKYAKHYPAIVLQVLFNTKKHVVFHVITNNTAIKQLDFAKLRKAIVRYTNANSNFAFDVHTIDEYKGIRVKEQMPSTGTGWMSSATYWRLYACNILPKDVDRCIYTDLDVLIRGDMQMLMDWNLENKEIGMALDFDKNDGYVKDRYCAGVQVLNLQRIRETNLLERMQQWSNTHVLHWHDQELANKVADIITLPQTFQCSQYTWWTQGAEPLNESPYIVHFIRRWKPWANVKVTDYSLFIEYKAYEKLAAGAIELLDCNIGKGTIHMKSHKCECKPLPHKNVCPAK